MKHPELAQSRIVPGEGAPAGRYQVGQGTAEIVFLILLFAAALLVRLWPIWQVHFWDEAVYLQNAEVICCGKDNYSELTSRPPLLSLLFAAMFQLWHHDYAASLLVAGINALGPLFLFWSGRMLFGSVAGAIGALLLTFSPFFVKMGNSLLTDSPALTLIVLSFCILLKAVLTNSRYRFALAGFSCAMAGLMRFPSLIILVVFPLCLLRARRRLLGAGLFALGLTLGFGPYLLWSRYEHGSLFATLRTAQLNVGGSVEPPLYYLQNFGEIFPWLSLAGAILWLWAWALESGIHWERQGDQFLLCKDQRPTTPSPVPAALLWSWTLVVVGYFSMLPHKELRYLIPMAAPWFLLAGRGLSVLLRARRRWTRTAGASLLALAMVYSFAPSLERFRSPFMEPYVSEEKRVADYLNQTAKPPGVLYTNFNTPVFAYYTRLPIRVILEQDESFYNAFPNNMPADGYVIVYKFVQKEPKPGWADADPHFRRLQEFPSLIVYEYRKSRSTKLPSGS